MQVQEVRADVPSRTYAVVSVARSARPPPRLQGLAAFLEAAAKSKKPLAGEAAAAAPPHGSGGLQAGWECRTKAAQKLLCCCAALPVQHAHTHTYAHAASGVQGTHMATHGAGELQAAGARTPAGAEA